MKRMFFIASIALFFMACETQNDLSDPNIVAESFLKAYITMDYNKAKTFATEEYKSEIDHYESENAGLGKEEVEIHKKSIAVIKGMEIMEAEGMAIVKYENSHLPEVINQLELKKVEENWYVNNVENSIDIELDKKFSEEEIEDLMEEAEEQNEVLPLENAE